MSLNLRGSILQISPMTENVTLLPDPGAQGNLWLLVQMRHSFCCLIDVRFQDNGSQPVPWAQGFSRGIFWALKRRGSSIGGADPDSSNRGTLQLKRCNLRRVWCRLSVGPYGSDHPKRRTAVPAHCGAVAPG